MGTDPLPTGTPGMPPERARSFARYPLLDALIERRSRRFGLGMRLNGGPLTYQSSEAPQPLSLEEEAALAFAACGVTGFALAELPYQGGGLPEASEGNIMVNFIGRTAASGHALHYVTVFVLNDEGAWMLRRPQDYPRTEIAGLIQAARDHKLTELYERARIRIADQRPDTPRRVPFVPPFNKWAANLPGTTYFLPVNEFTVDYKYAQGTGTLRDGGAATGWRDGAAVQAGIPRYSDKAIAATIAYCEYVYRRYGRFPASSGPFRTVLAHQAHHLDPEFYRRFYRTDALTETQVRHAAEWHAAATR